MKTVGWSNVGGLCFSAVISACAPLTYQVWAPPPPGEGLYPVLESMGYVLQPEPASLGARRWWIAVRKEREDRLEVRMVSGHGSRFVSGTGASIPMGGGDGLLISAQTFLTDARGRRAVRPSAGVMADADSLRALVRAALRRRGGPTHR
jgi:hypothetical protein